MTDYTCTNGHDKCNEMHASDICPYCVSAVKSPKPWIVERDAVGTPVMIRDAEGQIICEDKDYYPLAPSPDAMVDIVDAVNEHEDLKAALGETIALLEEYWIMEAMRHINDREKPAYIEITHERIRENKKLLDTNKYT